MAAAFMVNGLKVGDRVAGLQSFFSEQRLRLSIGISAFQL
jgi:hypothetical protein